MTKQEYIDAMNHNTKDMKFLSTGLCGGCETCQKEWGYEGRKEQFETDISTETVLSEPSFSWSHCEICGTALGGNRVQGHYVNTNGKIVHLDSVCEDCELFIANGDVPNRGPDDEPIV